MLYLEFTGFDLPINENIYRIKIDVALLLFI
jgi:hypothetical protein